MLVGIEVFKLIDPVEDVGHELLEEDAGRHPDLTAQTPGNSAGQFVDVRIISLGRQPLGSGGMGEVRAAAGCGRGEGPRAAAGNPYRSANQTRGGGAEEMNV